MKKKTKVQQNHIYHDTSLFRVSILPRFLEMIIISIENTFFFRFIFCMANSCPKIEKQALLNFKKSLNNPSNPLISSWNPNRNSNCCKCEGIVCSNLTCHVHQLHQLHLHSWHHSRISSTWFYFMLDSKEEFLTT